MVKLYISLASNQSKSRHPHSKKKLERVVPVCQADYQLPITDC